MSTGAAALVLFAGYLAVVFIAARIARRVNPARRRAVPDGAGLAASRDRHPSRVPGLPADGEPLSLADQAVIGRMETDWLIITPPWGGITRGGD